MNEKISTLKKDKDIILSEKRELQENLELILKLMNNQKIANYKSCAELQRQLDHVQNYYQREVEEHKSINDELRLNIDKKIIENQEISQLYKQLMDDFENLKQVL